MVQAAATSRNLGVAGIPNQLGVSGWASRHRSVVTKTFLASQQGGFDAHGDPDNILEKNVISAARPGNVASVIFSMMAEEDVEDVHHILGCTSVSSAGRETRRILRPDAGNTLTPSPGRCLCTLFHSAGTAFP